jgi:hypothetical protein
VTACVQLLVREREEVLGRAEGLPSGPILSGLNRSFIIIIMFCGGLRHVWVLLYINIVMCTLLLQRQ